MTTPIARHPTRVFPALIDELAGRYGDALALLSDRESFTYRELAARANQYARWSLAQGIQKGDTVCLMMPNRPEYMALWLGITRVGGVVALLNSNLTGRVLAYCVNAVKPKHVVVAADLLERLETAAAFMTGDPQIWLHGSADANRPRIDREVDALSGEKLKAAERRELTIEDRALYIYTSGTTGCPAATNHAA
jgi:fatty-acyl-CoA synthase